MLEAASAAHFQAHELAYIASALWWGGWSVPPGYFDEEELEELEYDDQEQLRRWVERELDRIQGRSWGLARPVLAAQEGGE